MDPGTKPRPDPADVERIYDQASELPPNEVSGFLDRACASCPEARREVESLLGWTREEGLAVRPLSASPLDGQEEEEVVPDRIGRYRDIAFLGRGGMGVVYRAFDPVLSRPVALKLLRGAGPKDRRRMLAEARAQARVDHENVCRVFEAGEVEGIPYIAMELIDGGTLDTATATLPLCEKVDLVRRAALALHQAHLQGLVHRDVKPGNILVKREEDGSLEPFVVDFGLARDLDRKAETVSELLAGTPAYMAPEQAVRSRDLLDPRTDVYGLGATLYHLLSGRPPFEGDSLEVLLKVASEDPPSLAGDDLPRDLRTIVMKCLERDPSRRYGSARALAEDLARFLSGVEVEARPLGRGERLSRYAIRHRTALTTIAATLCAALFILFLLTGLPRILARRADHRLLQQALAKKLTAERGFAEALRTGRLDDAIAFGERLFGRKPDLPPLLHDPKSALAYPELIGNYQVALPMAFLRRGVSRLRRGRKEGRVDLANAFRTAVEARQDDTGRQALVALGRDLLDAGDRERAAATLLIARARFGDSPELLAMLASVSEWLGHPEEALHCWRLLSDDGRYGRQAREAVSILEGLLPSVDLPMSQGSNLAIDLDGDETDELVHATLHGTVETYRIERQRAKLLDSFRLLPEVAAPNAICRRMEALDIDGDGVAEVVLAPGTTSAGRLYVLKNHRGRLKVDASAPLGAQGGPFLLEDATGDGNPELLVNVRHYKRALDLFRYQPGKLSLLWQEPIGLDISFMTAGPFGRQGERRILLGLGAWNTDRGFRLALLGRDPHRWHQPIAESPWRIDPRGGVEIARERLLIATINDPALREIVDDLPDLGVYTTEICNDRIGPLVRMAETQSTDADLAFGGHLHDGTAFLDVGSETYLVPKEGGFLHVLWDSRTPKTVTVCAGDVDGDGRSEVLKQFPEELTIWGLGREPPATADQVLPPVGSATRGSPGEDLLEARLYEEARALFRQETDSTPTSESWFGLGVAEAGLGHYRAASEAFAHVTGARELQALESRCRALQELLDWKSLAPLVEALAAHPKLDPMQRQSTIAWRDWVRVEANLERRFYVQRFDRKLPLGCVNPLLCRIDEGVLRSIATWSSCASAALVFRHAGGPLRLTFDFSLSKPGWATGASLGLASERFLLAGPSRREGRKTEFRWDASGATRAPLFSRHLSAADLRPPERTINGARHQAVPDPFSRYQLEIEYVPALRRSSYLLSKDGEVIDHDQIDLPFAIDKGLWLAGVVSGRMADPFPDDYQTETRIYSLTVDSSSAATRVVRPEAASLPMLLFLAGGEMAQGAFGAAMRDYAESIRRARRDRDQDALWRAYLFRAFALVRQGRPKEARGDLRRALRVPGQRVKTILDGAGTRLYPEEIAVLKSFGVSIDPTWRGSN